MNPVQSIFALSLTIGIGTVIWAQDSGGGTTVGSLGGGSNTHRIAPSDLSAGVILVSLKQLDNMEYHTDHGGCRLTNGVYTSQTIEEDVMLYREVMRGTYISGIHEVDHVDHAMGDLNNDGLQDAVVIIRENTGGTGVDIYLAIVMNEQGLLRNMATVYMGDRKEITSLAIGPGGMIFVSGFTHRPTEGYMQPTLPVVWMFRVQGKALELISGPTDSRDEYGKRFEKLMNEK